MAKIFIVMGKSATGKDTVYRQVMAACGEQAKSIVTYTTRPMRDGETEGVDYHFTTDADVECFRESGKIIELRTYQTMHGPWHYYTVDDGQIDQSSDQRYVIINTLEAYTQYVKYFGNDVIVPIYIEISERERIHRALKREDEQEYPKYAELCRRFLADEEDFSEAKLQAAGIVSENRYANNDLDACVKAIVDTIMQNA